MSSICANKGTLHFYLPYNPVPGVYLRAHWPQSPQADGSLTLHPWPPSAGQTLTLEQMDNGVDALSPPDHTLLLPCPRYSLSFHLSLPCLSVPSSPPVLLLIALNSQSPLLLSPMCSTFYLCVLPSLLPCAAALTCLTLIAYFTFTHFHFLPPSIRPSSPRCFSCALCLSALLQARWCALVRLSEHDNQAENTPGGVGLWLRITSYDSFKS